MLTSPLPSPLPLSRSQEVATWSSATVANQYIVRFTGYAGQGALGQRIDDFLSETLPRSRSPLWRTVWRTNAGSSLPTDFVLLEVAPGGDGGAGADAAADLVARLQAAPDRLGIRSVTPQRKVQRSLMSVPVTRRHTMFSFEGEPNGGGGGGGSSSGGGRVGPPTRRRLLEEGSAADQLQASALWDRGFTGKGVRVAVFDTGARGSCCLGAVDGRGWWRWGVAIGAGNDFICNAPTQHELNLACC